jgi:hypothetical protein
VRTGICLLISCFHNAPVFVCNRSCADIVFFSLVEHSCFTLFSLHSIVPTVFNLQRGNSQDLSSLPQQLDLL